MRQARTVHIIQHLPHIHAGSLREYLLSEGVAVNLVKAWELDGTCFSAVMRKVDALDALVVLGGSMNAYADTEFPWLPQVRALLASRVEAAGRTLGICLGHQLAAVALGGEVQLGALEPPEKSLTNLSWHDSELTNILGAPQVVYSDHSDRVSIIPEGGRVIAENENGVQALTYGQNFLTVQFHPEVNEQVLQDWYQKSEPQNLNEYLAAYRSCATQLDETVRRLARWLAQVRN